LTRLEYIKVLHRSRFPSPVGRLDFEPEEPSVAYSAAPTHPDASPSPAGSPQERAKAEAALGAYLGRCAGLRANHAAVALSPPTTPPSGEAEEGAYYFGLQLGLSVWGGAEEPE